MNIPRNHRDALELEIEELRYERALLRSALVGMMAVRPDPKSRAAAVFALVKVRPDLPGEAVAPCA